MWVQGIAGALGATAVIGLLAVAASASPADGPYLRLEGGGNFPSASVANSTGGTLSFKPGAGPIAGGALGMRLAPFRLEIDTDWLHSSISGNSPALSGELQNIPVMANGFFDFVNSTRLEPYIGLGAGITLFSLKGTNPSGSNLISSSTHVFAFQPIIGVNATLSDQLTAGIQYRYFRSVNPSLVTTNGQRVELTNSANIVLATLTYHFFAPKPPTGPGPVAEPPLAMPQPALAAAAPPPILPVARPAPHMFLVFFDFNSAKLTRAGRRSADEAVLAYNQDPTNDIEVRGFTDLVGSDAYNLELSKRRAMTVYDYFAAHGVKPADMGIDWEGKANPRVNTPKPEPQNRRVEIQM